MKTLLIIIGLIVSCGTDNHYPDHNEVKSFPETTLVQTDCIEKQIVSEECDRKFIQQCVTEQKLNPDECSEMFYQCQELDNEFDVCQIELEVNRKMEELSYETCYDNSIIRN